MMMDNIMRTTPTSTNRNAVLTNPEYVEHLLQLSRLVHCDIAIKVTIRPPRRFAQIASGASAPSATSPSAPAQLTITALKQTEYQRLPETSVCDEWQEKFYPSVDKPAQLWVAFYHMIEERGTTRIFGSSYQDHSTLLGKVTALHTAYTCAADIVLYLPNLYIADEFACDGATSGYSLPLCFTILRELANRRGYLLNLAALRPLIPAANGQLHSPSPLEDIYEGLSAALDTENGLIHIHEHRLGCYKLTHPAMPDAPTRHHLATLLEAADKALSGYGPQSSPNQPQSQQYVDFFMMTVTVSDLLNVSSPTSSSSHTPAIRYYAEMAAAVWKAVSGHVFAQLSKLRIPPHLHLWHLHEYFGPAIATAIAAVGQGAPQHGILHSSYSLFARYEGPLDDNFDPSEQQEISLAISADCLRDVGRLALDSNIIKPPIGATMGPNRITLTMPDNTVVSVPESSGTFIAGLVPSSTLIH